MTEQELAEIEARANAAKEGPWQIQRDSTGAPCEVIHLSGSGIYAFVTSIPKTQGDIEFVAHAREDVPALIAEVRRLRNVMECALWPEVNRGCVCPWCFGCENHSPDCMAFSCDGELR